MCVTPLRRRLQIAAGCVAIGVLGAMAIVALGRAGTRCPAVVRAARTFSLAPIEPGRYQWTLVDGSRPGGHSPVQQRVVEFDRGDAVELELCPTLEDGHPVRRGQVLASVRSNHHPSLLDELRATRSALVARHDLLLAGGEPAAVDEALRSVEVARAERSAIGSELVRLEALSDKGLVSAMELEARQAEHSVLEAEVERALAQVEVARGHARPEELAAVTAEIAAVDARIGEIEQLLDRAEVLSPMDGLLRVPGATGLLDVHEVDVVYLALAIPMQHADRVTTGTAVRFRPGIGPDVDQAGEVVALAEGISSVQGQPVVWASARVDNPGHTLAPGMTGTATLEAPALRPVTLLTRALTGGSP